MNVTCVGAARTVTGSCYLCQHQGVSFLVDCGMFQGSRKIEERNRVRFPFEPRNIRAVILTHAHIDHSGLLPRLVREGFEGRIFATPATVDLCAIMLPDSAHIQEMESLWESRKNARKGKGPLDPLYTASDAQRALTFFEPIPYDTTFVVTDGVEACFRDAGHILGSALVETYFSNEEGKKKVVFSGDLGNRGQPIVRDPYVVEDAHFVFIESTYGNRLHRSREDTLDEFAKILNDAAQRGGKVIIPAFAVERTQEVLYSLHVMEREGKIPSLPTYVDSPLAISATEIFRRHPECFDEETRVMLLEGDSPFSLTSLQFTRSTEESMAINELDGPALIISASGMCDAGRIKHHLKHNLWKAETHVVIIGFQAQGTTGRKLIDGAERIHLFQEEVIVRAKIHTLGGFSAHADQKGLIEWLRNMKTPDPRVYVVHGEEAVSLEFARRLLEEFPFSIYVPSMGESLSLVHAPVSREVHASIRPEDTLHETKAAMLRELHDLAHMLTSQKWEEDPVLRERVEAHLGKMEPHIAKLNKILGRRN